MMNEEDEEHGLFNEFEIQAKQRREAVKVAITKELMKSYDDGVKDALEVARDATIEEVAQHIEKLKGFGQDTVSSLAIYIRGMKK
jgi:predicted sugar kinase